MRKGRFSEEQIVTALREHAAGAGTGELCRRLGVSQETLYRWKRKYGGRCGSGSWSWPPRGGGSVTGGSVCSCAEKAVW